MPKDKYKDKDKAESDAPNYRFVGVDEPERCRTCKFAEDVRCTAYNFNFETGYTCDAWEGMDDDEADADRGYTEEAQKARVTYNGVTVTASAERSSSRSDKKFMREVTYNGRTRLVHYGDPNMEIQSDSDERREAFVTRHNCSAKKDPFSPGFWSCYKWTAGRGKADDGQMPESNALKAISKTDDELRVANYMVLFGGRDLEGTLSPRKNKDGSRGEYFTKATAFDSPYTEIDLVAVDWEHGHGELEKDEILGRVDWKTARIDERGLFVERILNRRNRYVKYLEELIEAGLIGNSSEAVSDAVEKAEDGQIMRWPVRRDTLTVSPMEPRMITDNVINAVKALSERYPSLKSLLPADVEANAEAGSPEADRTSADTVAEDKTAAELLMVELDLLLI